MKNQINCKGRNHIRGMIILSSIVLFALTGCSGNKNGDTVLPMKGMNILFLTADDLNYNSVGVFGCELEGITPNIDKLAEGGVVFRNAHTTTAVCMPCRQGLLTGLYPHNNGAEGFQPISDDITTLTELLSKAGYINGILGKEIHHQPREKFYWDFIPHLDLDSIWRKGHARTPSLFYEYSKKFFEMSKEQKKPFFLQANSHDPHRPFIGSESAKRTWGDNPPPQVSKYTEEDVEVLGYLPDIPPVKKEVTQYFNTVARGDISLGEVLRALKESGLEDNTMIIFMSDHGAAFPFAKSQCYLNSTKTPLIINWPGVTDKNPGETDALISGTDIMPTILEAVGVSGPDNLDGYSIAPLLLGKEYEEREYMFTTYYQIFAKIRYTMRGLQNQEYGYIYNFWSDGKQGIRGDVTGGITWRAMKEAAKTDPAIAKRVELFDHRVPEEFYHYKNDPDGLVNLVDNPEYADELNKFRELMLEYMQKYNDPAYEAYKDRNQEGVIESFMEKEREKAKKTPNLLRF